MKISNGTYINQRDKQYDLYFTGIETLNFKLYIAKGHDNFTWKFCYKAIIKSKKPYIAGSTGYLWTEYDEALSEGKNEIERLEIKLKEETENWKKEMMEYKKRYGDYS